MKGVGGSKNRMKIYYLCGGYSWLETWLHLEELQSRQRGHTFKIVLFDLSEPTSSMDL